ncbi:unnamed protein product [Urochloa humidicola]
MALSKDTMDLLQAQVELWNQTFSFMKSVALAVALDLRIADAICHHGGAATLSQIIPEIGISQSKLPGLRRLMRVLTVAGTFTIQQPPEASSPEKHSNFLPYHEQQRCRELSEPVPHDEPRAQSFP